MNKEKHNPNFDINTKYEDIINNSKKIAELHEFVSDGSCEPPSYICLAYDVKNYLPRLIKENQELKEKYKAVSKGLGKVALRRNKWKNRYETEHRRKRELINQQKEFIEWLEAYIEDRDKVRKLHEEYSLSEERLSSQYFILQQILSKYKEIIGVKDE